MEWPTTPQSRLLWRALASAVGLDAITSPHAQLKGRRVRIEIADGTVGRIGHVYAADEAEAPVTAVGAVPTDHPDSPL